ncbi:GntR family transcriptional regulator [[Ruminococcus] gnavus]|nr:GntR family transcriptional regulator [Mediterraneibacter gnavus]
MKCGEKLTLKVLKERFQVSSSPIREALTRLTQDQLVSYYSNIGVNVISYTANDLREIYSGK